MLIPNLPFTMPMSSDLNACHRLDGVIRRLEKQLHKNFKHDDPYTLPERYFNQFKWFEDFVGFPETALVIGSSYGREVFALMWQLGIQRIVGVDNSDDWSKKATSESLAGDIMALPPLVRECSAILGRHDRGLQNWYKEYVPVHIRRGVVMEFHQIDITDRTAIEVLDGNFDLVYTRYTLDKIFDNGGKEALLMSLANMQRLIKLDVGRMVVVVPTEKPNEDNGVRSYNFREHFREVGLKIVREEETSTLGYLELPETHPVGYILR